MTDDAKPQSNEERAAMESRQRAFEHAHDIWATVFSPLRPRRGGRPAVAGVGKLDVPDAKKTPQKANQYGSPDDA